MKETNRILKPVAELCEGDTLGRDLVASDGRMMLRQGAQLTPRLIEGIKRLGQHYVYVEISSAIAASYDGDWKSNVRRLSKSVLKQMFDSFTKNVPLPVKGLLDWADHITDATTEASDMTLGSNHLSKDHSDLIEHSLNVCMMSLFTAKALGYKPREIREVALGSLLHDIGLVLPYNGSLMLNHPSIGYDMLRRIPDFPQASLQIVLQHHEQLDGRGFPHGAKDEAFLQYSQICAMCSEFDYFMNGALTDRLPCEGIDFLMSKIDTAYGFPVVRAFLKMFQPYPVGTKVRLTGGLVGTVFETNDGSPRRPVVSIDASGSRFDLLMHTTFRIEEVLEAAEPLR